MKYFRLLDLEWKDDFNGYVELVGVTEIENPKEWVEEKNNEENKFYSYTYHLHDNGVITSTDDLDCDREDSTWYCPENLILDYMSKEAYDYYIKEVV